MTHCEVDQELDVKARRLRGLCDLLCLLQLLIQLVKKGLDRCEVQNIDLVLQTHILSQNRDHSSQSWLSSNPVPCICILRCSHNNSDAIPLLVLSCSNLFLYFCKITDMCKGKATIRRCLCICDW